VPITEGSWTRAGGFGLNFLLFMGGSSLRLGHFPGTFWNSGLRLALDMELSFQELL
jgi:hypothetical protein